MNLMRQKPNVNFWKVFAVGIIFAIISQIIHTVGSALGMNYYTDPKYFAMWSKIMMPAAGPPGMEFYAYAIFFGIITGMLFAFVYALVKGSVPGKTAVNKGLFYGAVLFLIGGIPYYLSMYLLLAIPTGLLFLWTLEVLLADLLGGIVIAKIVK